MIMVWSTGKERRMVCGTQGKYQPKVIVNYNKFINGVDWSDQILTTNSVLRKSMKWWKNLLYHLIDMAVVNGFILFKEHHAQFPDNDALKMPSNYC